MLIPVFPDGAVRQYKNQNTATLSIQRWHQRRWLAFIAQTNHSDGREDGRAYETLFDWRTV